MMKMPPHPLTELPFLSAALEDYQLGMRLASEGGNARQSVCLMHDAIEFVMYQILACRGIDVYKSGQNTIGFDDALKKCEEAKISLAHIHTIQEIQKRRGDAKHHAQTPDPKDFQRIALLFKSIFSVICFEHFGNPLATFIASRIQYAYHMALFDMYRRARRDQNWNKALMYALRALIHKRRAIYGVGDDFSTHQVSKLEGLTSILASTAALSATPEEVQKVSQLSESAKLQISSQQLKLAAETIGAAFSELDFISPTIFNISTARKLTPRLYQTNGVDYSGMWSMVENTALKSVFSEHPALVKSFGHPCYEQIDECSGVTWWEFVLFDGSRWLPFRIDEGYRISSEPVEEREKPETRPPNFSEVVVNEFKKATNEASS